MVVLSAKPTLNIIICFHILVLFVPTRNILKQHITPCPIVLAAVMCSFCLFSHTCPRHFSSV